jgi:hypothetical protein
VVQTEPGRAARRTIGFGTLLLAMCAFVVAGAPLVYYLWRVINDLLIGRVVAARLAIAAPVLLAFVGLLAVLARSVRRWEARHVD